MAAKVKYPIGIQDFEKLRTEGYLYVDKTVHIRKMVEEGCYYFLSRPRRFGKSLLLSTIKAYFEGKRELFKGLAIDTDGMKWEAHPVMHLDLNPQKYESKERLNVVLDDFLTLQEKKYGIFAESDNFGTRFCTAIRSAYKQTGKRVVILIDEYDKPMLQTIGNPELQDEYRNTLKAFYGALKTMDGSIQFAFLTGVTKFGKVSVFSDLNNLQDISMDARYYDICGISEGELMDCFKTGVADLAEANGMSIEECLALLKERYDGYHFVENAPGIYNYSCILNAIRRREFCNSWFETGTPSFLVKCLKAKQYNLNEITQKQFSADELCSLDETDFHIIPLLYLSGYLTIKGYDTEYGLYSVGFPNDDAREGFVTLLDYVKYPTDYHACIS